MYKYLFNLSYKNYMIMQMIDVSDIPISKIIVNGIRVEYIENLIKCGYDIKKVDDFGNALHHFSSFKHKATPYSQIVKVIDLLKKYINIDEKNKIGSAVDIASHTGSEEVAECLVKCGAKISKRILLYAISQCMYNISKVFIENGGYINVRSEGKSLLDMVLENHKTVDFFERYNDDKDIVYDEITQDSIQMIKYLAEKGLTSDSEEFKKIVKGYYDDKLDY